MKGIEISIIQLIIILFSEFSMLFYTKETT